MLKAFRNYLGHRRERQIRKDMLAVARLQKALDDDLDGFVQLVEPGSQKRFLDKNSTSIFELEHRYGVHIWLYAAVNAVAEKSAVPPLVIKNKDGEMMDSPLPPKPNALQTWSELEQLIAIWLELTGNAYVYHDKDEDEFYPMRPSRVRIVPDDDGRTVLGYAYNRMQNSEITSVRRRSGGKSGWLYDDPEVMNWSRREFKRQYKKRYADYKDYVEKGTIAVQGIPDHEKENWIPYEANEVLHFKYISPTSDYYGIPPIYPLLTNLETDLYARAWNKNFFENGAIPPGILILPKFMPKDVFEEQKREFSKQYVGTKNRGKPLFMQGGEAGANYIAFPGQHRDLEFLQGLDKGRDETLAVIGVPHEVLPGAAIMASHTSANSPGINEKKKLFWQDTLKPKLIMRAERWTAHYEADLPEGYKFGHDYSDVEELKPDWKELTEAGERGMQAGMTVEEVRTEIYGLKEEWEGVLLVPANVQVLRLSASPEQPALVAPVAPQPAIQPPADASEPAATEDEPMDETLEPAAD